MEKAIDEMLSNQPLKMNTHFFLVLLLFNERIWIKARI